MKRVKEMEEASLMSEISGGVLTFRIKGEIDHHIARGLRERMDEEIFLNRSPKIVIDLSEISFMDSSGLGLLLGRYTKARDIGSALSIKNPTAEIMRILALAGADKLIPIEKNDVVSRSTNSDEQSGGIREKAKSSKANPKVSKSEKKTTGKIKVKGMLLKAEEQ